MSAPTKTELADMNRELQETNRKLEKMSAEAMSLSRRLRNDVDEVEMAAAHFKRQRDTMIGFIEGDRKDEEKGPNFDSLTGHTIQRPTTRTDDFLDMMRQDPPIRDGVQRRIS